MERTLQELQRAQFRVRADVVLSSQQFTRRLRAKSYDLILAGYPAAQGWESQAVSVLQKNGKKTPLIFLTGAIQPETVAELINQGAADCVPINNIGHLAVAIRRVLSEETLRGQRDRAEEELSRSEAHYRALVGNLTYGICRCNKEGAVLDANQALMAMLGYATKEELLAASHTSDIFSDTNKLEQLLGNVEHADRSETLEADWIRKDGTNLKVRLSGREVTGIDGSVGAYEIIAEDVTKQRELEDYLRQQATRDSLTGLANYRCFVDALDSEIKRSKRTGREFALLLFDLDNLKKVNDRYGHSVGSQALCRLADALSLGSRDIDTAARFGGDEFALVLPETGSEAANLVSQRICNSFANDGRQPTLSVSVGIANYPKDGKEIEILLAAADVALYAMKGKMHSEKSADNSICLAVPEAAKVTLEAKHPIGSGADRRRRHRAKMVARVQIRGAIGTLDAFEDLGKSIDVSRDGILLTTSRGGYWIGQPLQVTFPFWSAPTAINMARRAKVVRNILMPDFRYAVAVEFEGQIAEEGPWVTAPMVGQVRVLGVESNPAMMSAMREILEKDGYHVVFVPTAQQALEIMKSEIPNVLVADAEGSVMSGRDLCATIKKTERLQHIPVILLTASALPSDYSANHRVGAIMCMMKPFEPERLQHAVHLVAPPPVQRPAYKAAFNVTSLVQAR